MTVNETLGALGSWSLVLDDTTPDEVLRKLNYFGLVAIVRGDVDVSQTTSAAVLAAARYVGVLREKPTNSRNLAGSGMRFWLGDENSVGKVRETPLQFTANTLTFCINAVLPPSVHVGTINDPGGTYTGTHQWETPRQTLDTICAAFGVEYRVNGDSTIDVGTQAQLYRVVPNSILSARGAGADMDMQSLGTTFAPGSSAMDYSSRIVLLGQTQPNTTVLEATADAAVVPYNDPFGNPVALTRMISDSGQTTGSVTATAQLNLNRFNRTASVIKVTADNYAVSGNFVVGDNSDVFDPDNGIVDTTRPLDFRGELIHPAIVRVSAMTWPLTEGHTVVYRASDGTLTDLTRWVVWETGTTDITVGDMPPTLTSGGNPVQQRVNSAPDASIPGPPTALTLSTTSVQSSTGRSTATVTASWTAPATNTDGTVVSDLSYYVVQYRWHGRAPQWDTRYVQGTTVDIAQLADGLLYDVQVAAVDLTGHVSAFTAVSSITSAPDSVAPPPPQDPTVSSYLGQLRIAWSGLNNVGAAMPSDFAIVEVHVSATTGFTPSTSTLVSQLSAAGAAYATAPYGATRYVKLVAVDNSLNRSAPSAQVSGATVQAGDGDIAALSVGKLTAGTMSADVVIGGRFATALTAARVEVNSLGLQGFLADGVTKWLSLTNTESLLTGIFKTASSGRRIEIGSSGALGSIFFYAPDGTQTSIQAFTSLGNEAIAISAPPGAGNNPVWNSLQLQANGLTFIDADNVNIAFDGSGPVASGGAFRVAAANTKGTPTTFPVTADRLVVAQDSHWYYKNPAGAFSWIEYGAGGSTQTRFAITQTDVLWYWTVSDNAYMAFQASNGVDRSPKLLFIHPHGSYGATLSYVAVSTDGFSQPRLEVKDAAVSTFMPIYAGLYTNASARASKTGIVPFTDDALAIVRSLRVRNYTRKPHRDADGKKATLTGRERVETGLIADEAHESILVRDEAGKPLGIDQYAYTSVGIRAIQQLADRVEALEGRKAG